MSSTILHPPAHLPPSVALQLSQQAPLILKDAPSSITSYSLQSLFAAPETADLWTSYENLMLSCLRTGDEQSAELCLERLTARFGPDNERVTALSGLFKEATADGDAELQKILKDYTNILANNPSNMPVSKRRIALLRSMGKTTEAIQSLNQLLDTCPTDAEAWSELSDLYVSQGMYQQAIFALEEVLLVTPNAWNIHARLAEVQYMSATASWASNTTEAERLLVESLRRFCRSVELCDDYLRGYYGMKITSAKLLSSSTGKQSRNDDTVSPLDSRTLESLNQRATEKLTEIVRKSVARETGWLGYDSAELIAARELLDRDVASITR